MRAQKKKLHVVITLLVVSGTIVDAGCGGRAGGRISPAASVSLCPRFSQLLHHLFHVCSHDHLRAVCALSLPRRVWKSTLVEGDHLRSHTCTAMFNYRSDGLLICCISH